MSTPPAPADGLSHAKTTAPTPAPAGAPPGGAAPPRAPVPPPAAPSEEMTPRQRATMIGVVIAVLLLVVLLIVAGYYLVTNPAQASVWRDVFIILMALEALFIGAALVVLMVQIAVLTNVLKNEIKPILEATQETVNTVRGTTLFVSENLTEPIMKLNSYVAGLSKIVETLSGLGSLFRRP